MKAEIPDSHIKVIDFNEKNGELKATFNTGAIYKYFDVDLKTVVACLKAPSVGSYFNNEIAKKHKYEKLKGID